jgi:hypothetical protein
MAYTPPKLTDTERQLSEFVFEHYYSNPKPGERSRVSDEFARNLRGNKDRIFRLATLLAKMVEPEYADKIGEVTGCGRGYGAESGGAGPSMQTEAPSMQTEVPAIQTAGPSMQSYWCPQGSRSRMVSSS